MSQPMDDEHDGLVELQHPDLEEITVWVAPHQVEHYKTMGFTVIEPTEGEQPAAEE
jgi:hypothetical protein